MTTLTRLKSEVRYLVLNWAVMPSQVLKLYNELDGFLRLLKYLYLTRRYVLCIPKQRIHSVK